MQFNDSLHLSEQEFDEDFHHRKDLCSNVIHKDLNYRSIDVRIQAVDYR